MAWTKEQEEAIYKEGTNIIVSAGAGSGKTAVLTERVLEKVKRGVPIRSLLILTFTKMAAKEMRERIESKLKKENLVDALNDLDNASITTFDAYSLSIVKKYNYLLNISDDINIIESSAIEIFKRNTLEDIFNSLYESSDHDFLSLIKDYALKDDKEIFNYILNLNNKLDLKVDKEEYLNTYIDSYFSDERIDNDIEIYSNYIIKLIGDIRNYLEYIDDSDYLDKLNISLKPLFDSNNYNEIRDSILTIKLPRCLNVSDITKNYKDKINAIIKEIKDLCSFDSVKDIRKGILMTKKNIITINKILKLLNEKVSSYKKEHNYYEYHDIAFLAIKLVRDYPLARNEIRDNLTEILIDEYQDTSDIEEEFISYISNNNVYVVGDIKQSIYRFRNANPYLFKNKYNNYSKNINGYKIDLNKNFRSRKEVINNINLIFERIMDDFLGGADYRKSHEMIFGNNTYDEMGKNNQNNNLEIYSYDTSSNYSKREIEAFIIAKDIKSKINDKYQVFDKYIFKNRNINYDDIAILVDNSKNFELYKKILEYYGIPSVILKDSNLTDGNLIILFKNILSLIMKIKDNIIDIEFKKLFMSIGRSFLFELDDNILFDYFSNNNFFESDIYKKCYDIVKNIDDISLVEIVNNIIDNFDIYNKLFIIGDYEENILKIDKLKEIVDNLEGLGYDIYDFISYLNDVIDNDIMVKYKESERSSASVKIMTIHASKGLEFSVVYYASLYNQFNIREAINKFSYDDSYGIIIPYKDNFLYNTIYHYLSYKNYVRENISERIRLFYVALTRAKEKMILLLPNKEKECMPLNDIVDFSIREKYKSFADILYSINSLIKPYIKSIDLESINLSKNYNILNGENVFEYIDKVYDKISVNEIEITSEETINNTFSKNNIHLLTSKEKDNLDKGIKLHELFEYVDFKNIDNLNEKEKIIISKFIDNIDLNYLNIYKEYEFVYDDGNNNCHGIIDLMLEYSDYINIIDYKLREIEDRDYLKQLQGYKEYIERTFDKKVNIYLYSVFLNKLEKI